MNAATALQASGLIADIVGAILLFVYGFPHSADYGDLGDHGPSVKTEAQPRAKLGLGLLILGFALQLMGALCTGMT